MTQPNQTLHPATATATAPATPKKTTFADFLRAAKFDEVLPSFMRDKAKDFVRLAMIDIPRNENLARIAQNAPQKVVSALMDCARLGLMPGPLGHVYLVPFKDDITVMPGYKGLIALARRTGEIKRVDVGVIYGEDDFAYIRGDRPRFEHVPNMRSQKRTNNDIVAVYAFAYDGEGRNIGGDVLTKADVDAIRKRSRTSGSGPWVTDYAEMAKKTAIRRASKLWPTSTEFAEALAMEREDDDDNLPTSVAPASGTPALENRPPLTSGSLYDDEPETAPTAPITTTATASDDADKGVGD